MNFRVHSLSCPASHLLVALAMGMPGLHTAVDDLESFLWVLVWSLIHIFTKSAKTTDTHSINNQIMHAMSSFHMNLINMKKAFV